MSDTEPYSPLLFGRYRLGFGAPLTGAIRESVHLPPFSDRHRPVGILKPLHPLVPILDLLSFITAHFTNAALPPLQCSWLRMSPSSLIPSSPHNRGGTDCPRGPGVQLIRLFEGDRGYPAGAGINDFRVRQRGLRCMRIKRTGDHPSACRRKR